jgi:hypothetical protein
MLIPGIEFANERGKAVFVLELVDKGGWLIRTIEVASGP